MRKFLHNVLTKSAKFFETKSNDYSRVNDLYMSYGLGYSRGIGWLSALGSINYYTSVAPIANAVDLIAETASRVYISVYDKTNDDYIKNSVGMGTPQKVLKLLEGGNFNQTYTEFMRSLMSYYLITGNCFIISQATSDKTDIIELFIAKPQDITIFGEGTSIATYYKWQDGTKNLTFKLNPMTFRYEAEDNKGFFYELKHVKNFNPKYGAGNLWGMSLLTQLYLEMEQYILGAVHNNSLLRNEAKPSGVITTDEEMGDDAYEKLRKEIREFYSGAENAGKLLLFEGQNATFTSFAVSPRDMDYTNLVAWVENALYARLKIPRPLISDKAMTYNNLSEGLRQLYVLAIFPQFDMILEALTDLIFSRYKDGANYEIYYDVKDIDAFAEKQMETDEKIVRLGITTYNEARGKFNLPDMTENGDVVFAPPSLAPLGNVQMETKQQRVPVGVFKSLLKKQNFSEEDINRAVVKIYGKDN